MSDHRELYQETILDHSRSPRNKHAMPDANHHADGYNRLCGDKLSLYLKIENGVIEDISFIGEGCAISTASASLMTETLKGKRLEDVSPLFEKFHNMVAGSVEKIDDEEMLGKLLVFSGVREFPVRVKCATLAWHTLQAALKDNSKTVSTE
ncbi:MAG TPA: SUF system NifU family Fe-S cluster assembly protein [Phycisphaerae bacterium]|nr:SUF system NifU family Fe-S cluster assembly protein [Phycisphaerae bacterium]